MTHDVRRPLTLVSCDLWDMPPCDVLSVCRQALQPEKPTEDGSDAGPLRFIVYSWGEVKSDRPLPWGSQSGFLAALPTWGLTPVPMLAISDVVDDVEELLAAHTALAACRLSLAGGY
jgi:hypothetical protein